MTSLRPLRSGDADGEEARVDIAPLIDVVFLLLIFYVVAATFVTPTAVPVQRPISSQANALPNRPVIVTLGADGIAWLGNQVWQTSDISSMQQALSTQSTTKVILHADGTVPTQRLVETIDGCRAAGASTVDLAADRQR